MVKFNSIPVEFCTPNTYDKNGAVVEIGIKVVDLQSCPLWRGKWGVPACQTVLVEARGLASQCPYNGEILWLGGKLSVACTK